MTALGVIAFFLVLLGVSVWSHLEIYKRGYARGRKDADRWWDDMEEEADRERVKIWREEQ